MYAPSQEPLINAIANAHTCYGMRTPKRKFHMALLTAYFDESGVHGSDVCVVAGFVGNDAQWLAMAAEWVPAIRPAKNLHMRKLRWKHHESAVARRLAKLGPIPHKYNLRPVVVRMNWDDYNSVVKSRVSSKFTEPYVVCAICAINVVLHELAGDDEVYFLFDRQEGLRRETMEELRGIAFEWMRSDRRVKGLDFMKHEDTVCLDPADYLAYIARERSLDPNSLKAKAGESIIGTVGNGGWIPRPYLEILVNEELNPRPFQEIVKTLMENPYFVGPTEP